jgi:polysaccharide export outer membrane protein
MKRVALFLGLAVLAVACATAGTMLIPDQPTASGRIKGPEAIVLQFLAGDVVARSLEVKPDGTTTWQEGHAAAAPDAIAVWVKRGDALVPYVNTQMMSPLVDAQEFVIGPGDVLDINVWKNPDVSRQVPVRPDGRISLPLLGDVPAAGFTPAGLKVQLQAQFTRFIANPEVTVVVSQVHSYQIYVQGTVSHPGTYPIDGRTTLVQAISLAGGLGEFAGRGKIVILRQLTGGAKRFVVNYDDIVAGARPDEVLRPGDTIIVP